MYILGISSSPHDTSACLLKDGVIVAAAEEERFIRIKHAENRMPIYSSRYCLNQQGIELDDLDFIVLSRLSKETRDQVIIHPQKESKSQWADELQILFPNYLFQYKKLPSLAHVSHHLAHAASAFRCSDFQQASIITVDGRGEHSATTIGFGQENEIKILREFDISQSLGAFYSALSTYVGLGGWGEGKTMGLAAYGNPREKILGIQANDAGYEIYWPPKTPRTDAKSRFGDIFQDTYLGWLRRLTEQFGKANQSVWEYSNDTGIRTSRTEFPKRFRNIAAIGQECVERILLQIANVVVQETGCRDLALAGGVALNCSANGRLVESGIVDRLFVQPAANDGGLSIGAALELYARLGNFSSHPMRVAAYGPQFEDAILYKTLKDAGISYKKCENPAETGAKLLEKGHVIGWFQGRMEIGPRALGQRSILANPSVDGIKNHLNKDVKHRENFRPFSLSLRVEDCDNIFEYWKPSPHMILSFKVKESWHNLLGAGIHVDGTTRPQIVIKEDMPLYWQLITNFKEKTGIPAIVNTSFNDQNEPIVCTPLDALRSFFSMQLDYLLIGSFLISK